jgi:hypothetical protein
MYRNLILVTCVLCAAILIGCSKTETSNTNTTADNSNKGTTTKAEKTAPAGDKIGIAECDDYIAKYEACTPKVPEAGRAAYKSGLDSTRASWKKLADNPQTKGALAAACKQALQTAEATWKGYGCQ